MYHFMMCQAQVQSLGPTSQMGSQVQVIQSKERLPTHKCTCLYECVFTYIFP
jgi:hypothetical protein